jgi:hypothetical protein
MNSVLRRLRISRVAVSEEVLDFWRSHGAEWAREEADFGDLERVAKIVDKTRGMIDQAAAAQVAADFREIWRAGFSDPRDAFGWNEMNDGLPEAALLAFARGAHSAFQEVRPHL